MGFGEELGDTNSIRQDAKAIIDIQEDVPFHMQHTEIQASIGYWSLIRRNSNYRSLWIGEIISLFGDWFNLLASAALVSNLTQSGLAVGGLFVIRMLAPFLISPLAGVAADRYSRKMLLVISDLSRALVVIGFLFVREPQHVWLLYVLTAVQLGISGLFFPARNAILPDIVTRGELGAANALSSATWSVMLALGSAIGGIVAGEWGIYPAFVIDSLTFLLSAVFISQISYQSDQPLPGVGTSVSGVFQQYIDGLAYLKHHVDVLAISLNKAAVSLTMNGVFQVIQVVLAEQVFVIGEGGSTSLGLMYAVAGLGTGMGPIMARRYTGDRNPSLRWALVAAYALMIFGLVISAPLNNFALLLLGIFLRSFGSGINWVFSTQLLLHKVPDYVRGRVFSTEFALFTLANAISAAAGGWLLDNTAIDLVTMMWLMVGFTIIPAVLWTLWIGLKNRDE
jgi:MFS family permease